MACGKCRDACAHRDGGEYEALQTTAPPWIRWLGALLLVLGPAAAATSQEPLILSGRILDTGGRPLPRVQVELQALEGAYGTAFRNFAAQPQPAEPVSQARTSREGTFRLTVPAPGLWSVTVRHRGKAPAVFHLRPLLESTELPELALPDLGEVAVRLVDKDGYPFEGVRLAAQPWSQEWSRHLRRGWRPALRFAATDENGLAKVPYLAGEELMLAATGRGLFLWQRVEPLADGGGEIALRMADPLLSARLVDANGQPAAGWLAVLEQPYIAVGKSGPKGEILLPLREEDPPPLRFASAAGMHDALEWEVAPEGERVTVRLPAIHKVSGEAFDVFFRQPVEGALVWTPDTLQAAFLTDGLGRFDLYATSGRESSFRVYAPGYRGVLHTLPAWPEDEPMAVSLVPAMSRHGRVLSEDGRPIAGALIEATPSAAQANDGQGRILELLGGSIPSGMRVEGKSRGDGSFVLDNLMPGVDYRVVLTHERYLRTAVLVPGTKIDSLPQELVFEMGYGAAITAQVLSQAGEPIEAARLVVGEGSYLWGFPQAEGRSDSAGTVEIHGLEAGTYDLGVLAQGFLRHVVRDVSVVAEPMPKDLGTLILETGVPIHGVVRDASGEPVVGAMVRMLGYQDLEYHTPFVLSDAQGAFQVAAEANREWRLTVHHRGYQSYSKRWVPVGEEELEIVLEPSRDPFASGATVSGQVRRPDGSAAAGAEIDIRRLGPYGAELVASTRADQNGAFLFSTTAGRLRLEAQLGPLASDPLEVDHGGEPSTGLILDLRATSALHGRVTGTNQLPLVGAVVLIESLDGSFPHGRQRRLTSETDGTFALSPVSPGAYRVMIRKAGYRPMVREVSVATGVATEIQTALEAAPGLRVHGRVVDAMGRPLSGIYVLLRGPHGNSSANTFYDGRFEVMALGPGSYRLRVSDDAFADYETEPFELDDEPVEGLEVVLTHGGSIVGHFPDLPPEVRSQIEIGAFSRRFGHREGHIGEDGSWAIRHLAPGTWKIRVDGSADVQVEVEEGREAWVDLTLGLSFTVSGVTRAAGQPLPQAIVWLSCAGQAPRTVLSDHSGQFMAANMRAGMCEVSSSKPGTQLRTEIRFELSGDREVELDLIPVP